MANASDDTPPHLMVRLLQKRGGISMSFSLGKYSARMGVGFSSGVKMMFDVGAPNHAGVQFRNPCDNASIGGNEISSRHDGFVFN
jgi:hypothetical protein